jgi:hypothetical protein
MNFLITKLLPSTITSDCGFTIAGSITRVQSSFLRKLANLTHCSHQHLPLNYVRKVELTQSRVAVVYKGEAAFASDCK